MLRLFPSYNLGKLHCNGMTQVLCTISDSFYQVHMFTDEGSIVTWKVAKKALSHFHRIIQKCLAKSTPQLFPSVVNRWAQYSLSHSKMTYIWPLYKQDEKGMHVHLAQLQHRINKIMTPGQ